VLFVLAPLMGALIERLLTRSLGGVDTSLTVTIGLLLLLLALATIIWDPSTSRVLPQFFAGNSLSILGVVVTWHQLTVVIVTAAVAVALRLFLSYTRSGTAMRAVIDDPELASMAGASPSRFGQYGWALGAVLAALAGILLAPLVTLDINTLTLLVINGYAAALIGRLRHLTLTFAGGLVLGLVEAYAVGYLPVGSYLSEVKPVIPMVFLLVALLVIPQGRLRAAGRTVARRVPRVAGLRESIIAGAVFVAITWVVSAHLSSANLATAGHGIALSIIMLSLVLLVGYGGQVSLCQLTFAGLGAFAMGEVAGGGSWLGVIAGIGLAGAVGALVALPAIRLRGLYLALSTLAFAEAMDYAFFQNTNVFGTGGAISVGRVHIPGISLQSPRAFLVLLAVVFAVVGIGVLAVRRSAFGRRLVAMGDSPPGTATVGIHITRTKLIVFTASAALAGLGGVLYGGEQSSVGANDFQLLYSLTLLLLAIVWGIKTVSGMLVAGLLFAIFPVIQSHIPAVRDLLFLAVGLGAVTIGRNPNGVMGWKTPLELWRARRSAGAGPPEVIAPDGAAPSPPTRQVSAVPALELRGIRASYGRTEVLHGVDLQVPHASVLALLGPNGAGKTTTLRVACGRMVPTAGDVRLGDSLVSAGAPDGLARDGVCLIPEGRGVFPNLCVADNLRIWTYRGGISWSEVEERTFTRFPRLRDRRSRLAGTLSSGEQQMLAISRALSTDPTLLLLDEISLGLAPTVLAELYEVVAQLAAEGIAIVIVEEFLRTALGVADRAAIMAQGRIQLEGTPGEVGDAIVDTYLPLVAAG
ncbi:MAG TPA: ATP-binding cassette domain-containing protein, partial [Acidimicrobiales bacterium]|nr:ATP-binding cassette domain-containing protein [Acidimicrobiales bacterium]